MGGGGERCAWAAVVGGADTRSGPKECASVYTGAGARTCVVRVGLARVSECMFYVCAAARECMLTLALEQRCRSAWWIDRCTCVSLALVCVSVWRGDSELCLPRECISFTGNF